MVKNAQIEVEEFPTGVTVRWRDCDGEEEPTKNLAEFGQVERALGEEIWRDLQNHLEESESSKVLIHIRYEKL